MVSSEVIAGEPCVQLMEPVDGRPLSTILLYRLLPGIWRVPKGSLEQAFTTFGHYLGNLHTETMAEPEPLDVTALHLDKYNAITSKGIASPLETLLEPETIEALRHRIDQIRMENLPTSLVHGDPMLFHVYLDGSDVTIIDFDRTSRAHPLEDVATVLAALDLYTRRFPHARRRQYESLVEAFETGYRSAVPTDSFSRDLLDTLQAIRHCSFMLYYVNDHIDSTGLKHRILERIDVPKLRSAVVELVSS